MARKYIVTEIETGTEYVGTAKELSDKLSIGVKTISKLANGIVTHKRFKAEEIIENKKIYSSNEMLDRKNAEARKYGMSYGHYIGITETLHIPIEEYVRRFGIEA